MVGPNEYGRHVPLAGAGGVIEAVVPGSPADLGGLLAGDVLVSAHGQPLRDVIDWQWLAEGAEVDVVYQRGTAGGTALQLCRPVSEPWGIAFTETVFDGVRTCDNRCAFCFMTQLPKGLRKALYLRDDDFRLSFLQGNFVTLTNLSDDDMERIIDQHLSPLYVSLHTVDAKIRERLVCARDDRALERLDELLSGGIDVHVQIVLVPGVNDGPVLEESLMWLAERVGVLSVGIVPLGYTAHQSRFEESFESAASAREVVKAVVSWQVAMRERDDYTWVYLADEFYLNAGVELPPADHYDDFPQYENGIGMVRDFTDSARVAAPELKRAIGELPAGVAVTLATGELFAPVLERELLAVDATKRVSVVGVRNEFFGGNVGVAGLLTTSDLVRDLGHTAANGVVLLPDCVVNADGVLLDGASIAELGTALGRDVRLLSCDVGGLLSGLRDVADNPPII